MDSADAPLAVHCLYGDRHRKLHRIGANFVHAGLWRPFAIRDGNLITGQQNFSGRGDRRIARTRPWVGDTVNLTAGRHDPRRQRGTPLSIISSAT